MTGKHDKKNAAPDGPRSFEKGLERLEAIVEEMGSGRMPLDNALKLYEEGSKLAELCRRRLEEAEKKIEILSRRADGSTERQPFGDPSVDGTDVGDAASEEPPSPSTDSPSDNSGEAAAAADPADEADEADDGIDLPF